MVERPRTHDLEEARRVLGVDARLAVIPASHVVRGFLFKMTEDAVARAGAGAVAAFRHVVGPRSRWVFRAYPVREYIEEAAVAAAILGPEDPAGAIERIWGEAPRYAPLLNAERFVSLLGIDVLGAMRWLEQQRDTFCNFGSWRLEPRGQGELVMHYFEEWVWIDSAHRGGIRGVLEACRAEGELETTLDSPYDGRIRVTWHGR